LTSFKRKTLFIQAWRSEEREMGYYGQVGRKVKMNK